MSMTVTVTQTGSATKNGTGLAVRVVNGALPPASQTGATATGNTTTFSASLTPHAVGSQVYTAIVSYASGSGSFTWQTGETGINSTADATNAQVAGNAKLTALTVSASPITVGALSGPGPNYHFAIAEILGTTTSSLAEDGSTPAAVYNAAGISATTASFTPPPGSLLVALAEANTTASGTQNMSISDTAGLTWTQLVINPGGFPNTAIWVAQVPAVPFPASPLDLRADISAGGWQNVSGLVYQREGTSPPVSITRGKPDETPSVTPSSAAWQFNNRSGNFSPKNPLGTWYGKLGRNTPVRFSVPAIGNHLRLEDAVSAAVCPDAAALDITGDTDVRIDVTLTGIGPFGTALAAKGFNGIFTGSQTAGWSWVLALNPDLTPVFAWSADGTTIGGLVSGQLPVPARGRFALRATLAVATGTVTFYTAATMGGSFTQLGAAASGTLGAATSVHSGAGGAPLTAGMATGANGVTQLFTGAAGLSGRVWELRLLSGIGGTLVANPVFSSQTAGATSFADAQANAWGMYGTAEISSRDYRYHGELSQLPPKWDLTGTDHYVAVTAGGLLRRLGQGSAPLLSPMARYYTVPGAPVTAAAWPMEDAAGSTQLGATVGQLPMYFTGSPTLASSSVFTGSSPLPVSNGASFTATVAYTGTWTDNDVHWLMQMPSAPEPDGTVVAVIAMTGAVAQLTLTYNTASSGSLTLKGYDGAGALLFTGTTQAGVNGKAYAVQVAMQAAGTSALLNLMPAGTPAASGSVNVSAGAVGAVRRVTLNPNGGLAATVFGHLAVLPVLTSLLNLNLYQASPASGSPFTGPIVAWQYEPAGVRAGRLALEQGFQFRGIGSLSGTAVMGPQSATDLVSLLAECEAADRGMVFEPRQCLGLGYRARSSLYNQAATVLDYAQATLGGTGTALEPTYDDQYLRNDETVSRSGGTSSGASARYVLADGSAMSVSPPPVGIGTYANSDSLNLAYDGQLLNEAAWIAHVGTVDEARWPIVPLNLARPQLTAPWYSLLDTDIGDRFQVPNLPSVVMYDPADQLAAQVKESLGGLHYEMEWCAIPAKPYTVAVAGTAHAATAGSVLAAGAISSAPFLSVATIAGNIWTTAAGDFPFDINVAGERMTVTNITGASSPQTFSVTRSVNGVVKAQVLNTPVQLWTLPVAAL